MVHLPKLIEKYSDRAEFLFIYNSEMKKGFNHQLPEALREFADPPDAPEGSQLFLEQRVRAGMKNFNLRMACLLDNEQGQVQKLYGADPKRLLIVDPNGRIALDSGNMPSEDFPWKEITDWLDHYGEPISPPGENHG